MAKVLVSRQTIDDDNQLEWVIVEIDETELLEGEMPYPYPDSVSPDEVLSPAT